MYTKEDDIRTPTPNIATQSMDAIFSYKNRIRVPNQTKSNESSTYLKF